MKAAVRLTLLATAILGVAVVGAIAFGYWKLVPSDVELTERIRAQAEARLGVKVTVASAQLRLWPQGELVIEQAATVQPQPIRFQRLVARPELMALLRGRVELGEVQIDGAVLPQLSLRALRLQPAAPDTAGPPLQVSRVSFRDLVWVTRHGTPLEFEGSARFGPDWQLQGAEVVRSGARPATRLALTPDGDDRWRVELQLGGGTANGQITLKTGPDGAMVLAGKLAPRNVDVGAAMSSFKRNSAVHGQASGVTELSARGKDIGELARSLQTRTSFSVASPRLLHIDVDKAIRSFGQDRAGQTALLSLTGQMDTQNTADGIVVRYTGLEAKGETFSARGAGTIANRRIDGALTVDLVGGLVGVPLKISGPLQKPQVTVEKTAVAGAAAGAAIGTVILPGIGTAIGAGIGATLGKLFGGDQPKQPAPVR
ncbi:MAG: hypothetical protein LH617_07220 [Ramlibacter sp.]|nr:hypothetical protein [Ramlibacter sp.]